MLWFKYIHRTSIAHKSSNIFHYDWLTEWLVVSFPRALSQGWGIWPCDDSTLISFLVVCRESSWWLLLAFGSKILGGGRDLRMVLCDSMNTGWVVGDSMNTSWVVGTLEPYLLLSNSLEFLTLRGSRNAKINIPRACLHPGAHSRPNEPWWNIQCLIS